MSISIKWDENINNIILQTNLVPTSLLWGQAGYSEGAIMSEIADVGLKYL